MGRAKARLNGRALMAMARAYGAGPLEDKAREVVSIVRAAGYECSYEMRVDRNGRPVAIFAITEARGLAAQAKHGIVTRAAAQAGLDINRYFIR